MSSAEREQQQSSASAAGSSLLSPRQLPGAPAAAAHAGYGYALWLVPAAGSEAERRLAATQRVLSPGLARHHPPHATLLCHLRSLPQARAVAAAVAAAVPPFTLSVGPRVEACTVRYSRDAAPAQSAHCHAVHASASGAGFEAACRAAHSAAVAWSLAVHGAAGAPLDEAPSPSFQPHKAHISLAYRYSAADFSAQEVAAMDAAAAGGPACAFVADRVAVASVHGLWPDWRVVDALPMRGAEWAAAPSED